MNRRVYVMDCGDFVKIGVSINPDHRKNQIPYKVNQYYCTKPVNNPFEIERLAHKNFKSYRVKYAKGKEYFNIGFGTACNFLRELTGEKAEKPVIKKKKNKAEEQKEILDRLSIAFSKLKICEQVYILGLAEGMAMARQSENKEKELQEV